MTRNNQFKSYEFPQLELIEVKGGKGFSATGDPSNTEGFGDWQ